MKPDKKVCLIKNKIAKDYGYTLEMPTAWDYAMLATHRTKTQINMYELLVEILSSEEYERQAVHRWIDEGRVVVDEDKICEILGKELQDAFTGHRRTLGEIAKAISNAKVIEVINQVRDE